MAKVHVKKDDLVYVLSGKDRAKTGKVLDVNPKTGRVVVEGVNLVKKHTKPKKMGEVGGIIETEAAIDASNVMLVDPKSGIPTKTGVKVNSDGQRVRYAKNSGTDLGVIGKSSK